MRGRMALLGLVVWLLAAGTATAGPNLLVGVSEDSLKWRTAETSSVARDLGLRIFRVTLPWAPGQRTVEWQDAEIMNQAVVGASGMRVVLAVYARPPVSVERTPNDPQARDDYCAYVSDALRRFPQIGDVVIWNEPNLSYFWKPQFDGGGASVAPAAYAALLAHCWDVLHATRADVNIVAPATSPWGNDNPVAVSNISHSPVTFIKRLGEVYRSSGRGARLFDVVGHHPHPAYPAERPWREHPGASRISQGDWLKLMKTLDEAFGGTAQPIPGEGIPIWYLEMGYQTVPDEDKRWMYTGEEFEPFGMLPDGSGPEPGSPVPAADSFAPDQATQLADSLRLAYCQPYVDVFFNFLLRDEHDLQGWQSGVLWADGTPKGSYETLKQVTAEVHGHGVNCNALKGGAPPEYRSERPPSAPTGGGASTPAVPGRTPTTPAPGRGTTPGAATPVAAAAGAPTSGKRVARLAYVGPRRGLFGFVTLVARLEDGSRPLGGREVAFTLGNQLTLARTDAEGRASAALSPTLGAGRLRLEVAFPGDADFAHAGIDATLTIANARGTTVRGELRQAGGARASFEARSLASGVTGKLVFRRGGRTFRFARILALGVAKRSAWFTGSDARGRRFAAYLEDNGKRGRKDVFQLWVDDKPLSGNGSVTRGDVAIIRGR